MPHVFFFCRRNGESATTSRCDRRVAVFHRDFLSVPMHGIEVGFRREKARMSERFFLISCIYLDKAKTVMRMDRKYLN